MLQAGLPWPDPLELLAHFADPCAVLAPSDPVLAERAYAPVFAAASVPDDRLLRRVTIIYQYI